ncbi:MAG: MFS transporter [Verrucomicrobiota bacterium]
MRKPLLNPRRPFDVGRFPAYYGWVILIVGTIGMSAAVPGSPPGMSVFVDGMVAALEMDLADFSLAYLLGTIAAGVGAPFAGRYVDLYGARAMGCLSFISLGLILLYTGWIVPVYNGLGGNAAFSGLAFVLTFIAFAGMRLAGLGLAMTTCRAMIFRWFEGRRGLAAAVNGSVLSLTFSSSPAVLNGFVRFVGWEMAWIWLGLLFLTVFALMAYLFFRDSPESCGIELEQGIAKESMKVRVPLVKDFTAKEVLGTASFWIFVSGLALNALIGTGIAFHIVGIGAAQGVSQDVSVQAFIPQAVCHIAITFLVGGYAEKLRLKYVLLFMIVAQTVSLYGIMNFGDPFWRWLFILGGGSAWGCFGVLINLPWGRFYGRKYLGSIMGWVTGVTVVMSALGPYLYGLSDQLTGSFQSASVICLIISPFVIFVSVFADNPQEKLGESDR